jgi:hypothetical protein
MAYTDIDKPDDYFNTKLYTGNGGTQTITGVGFQPNFVWFKSRDTTHAHALVDSVRGTDKVIHSNTTQAEQSISSQTFNSDGYVLVADGTANSINSSGSTKVAWNFLAGGTASSNTDGSITSSVSASTTSGFSIVSYTGTGSNATIGHGLGAVPQVVLLKERNGTNNWLMSHQPLSASLGDYSRFMTLNSTSAVSGPGNIVFQNSAFTSSVFNVGASSASNGSGQNFIAYCFADTGNKFFKAGSYTGNGSTDGTFVYTGFKPAFILLKASNNGSWNWRLSDSTRTSFNSSTFNNLFPSSSDAEVTHEKDLDYLSNGFKLRTSGSGVNASGYNVIYMAFASEPFTTSTGIPCTAR